MVATSTEGIGEMHNHNYLKHQDQNHRKFHISGNMEPSMGSHQSTKWSCLGSNQGSLKGSPNSTNTVVGMFERMKLQENSYYGSNIGTSTYHQSLSQDQIRAIHLSRLKQEQILSLKQKLFAYRESHDRILPQQHEPNEEIMQFQKKWKAVGVPKRRTHQTVSGSTSTATSCGTGVFLPCAIGALSGKGCPTVLIPARVVQALQLHFEQLAVTPGPKVAGFPPLHDVIVNNRDGMYSIQSRKANIQNEMILPQEWTY